MLSNPCHVGCVGSLDLDVVLSPSDVDGAIPGIDLLADISKILDEDGSVHQLTVLFLALQSVLKFLDQVLLDIQRGVSQLG